MELIKKYFFDTYALVEIFKGNNNYQKYQKDIGFITTKLNLMELHYVLLKVVGKETANELYYRLLPYVVEFDDELMMKANLFKFLSRKRKLSSVDCLGYLIAKQKGIPFLTGDRQFLDLPSVEFVK